VTYRLATKDDFDNAVVTLMLSSRCHLLIKDNLFWKVENESK